MAATIGRTFFARFPSSFTSTLIRFPLAVLLAVIATAIYVANEQIFPRLPEHQSFANIAIWAITCAMLWAVVSRVWGEVTGQLWASRAAALAGVAFFAVYFKLWHYWFQLPGTEIPNGDWYYYIIFPGIILSTTVMLAPFLRRAGDNDALWQFNHKVWTSAIMAFIGGLLFFAGINTVIETLNTLFALHIPRNVDQFSFPCLYLVPALIWLTLFPTDFDEKPQPASTAEITSRGIALLVKFIFIPLICVFSAILAAYCVKIALFGGFSTAKMGEKALIFGICLVITALFAYPNRQASLFLRVFWVAWPWLLVPFVLLGALSLEMRLEEYGVTVERYLAILVMVWLTAVAVYFATTRSRGDLRAIPAMLGVLFLVGSAGPWGAYSLTIKSQYAILERILERNGTLVAGRLAQPLPTLPSNESRDQNRAHSALAALSELDALDTITPWFAGVPNAPDAKSGEWHGPKRLETANTLLGLSSVRKEPTYVFITSKPFLVPVTGVTFYYGPRDYTLTPSGHLHIPTGPFEIDQDDMRLRIADQQGKFAVFDLEAIAASLYEQFGGPSATSDKPATFDPVEGALKARLMVQSGQVTITLPPDMRRKNRIAGGTVSASLLISDDTPGEPK